MMMKKMALFLTEEDTWFVIILTLCIALVVKATLNLLINRKSNPPKSSSSQLPPQGPLISLFRIPILGPLVWLRKSTPEIESTLRSLRKKWGIPPAITVRFISGRPLIFVFSRSLAHKALVDNGAVFADRPDPVPTARIMSSNQHSISSAAYGDTWRILRRNLTSQILHPSKLKSFSNARSWVLGILIDRLMKESSSTTGTAVRVVDHLRYAMFCLLVLMCFGDKFEEHEIRKVESVPHGILVSVTRFQLLNLRPLWLSKLLFRARWKEFFEMRQWQQSVIIPFISRRQEGRDTSNSAFSYVDSLLQLQVPDDDNLNDSGKGNDTNQRNSKGIKKRKLTEPELVSACSEFLNAGTDTTTTGLQWIMANLVKNPEIQAKLYEEIKGAGVGEVVEEEDLPKLVYLKALVLEGLRRHPPGHFVLPHAVTHEVEVDGFLFPKNSTINFMVADIGWDAQIWDDPMQFKPDRFLPYLLPSSNGGQFDITGSRDIKMMPFGVGRRICPAFNLAILHLEYFVANLIWRFEWRGADGYEVDLSEKQEFTTVMKFPLHAQILPRVR